MWGLNPQTSLDETDCYAIYLQASDMESGTCMASDAKTVFPISRLYGLYQSGQTVTMEVPAGNNRTIGVFAFLSSDGSCSNTLDVNFKSKNHSQPLLIGTKTQTLSSGDNEVIIDISMDKALAVESCTGSSFSNLAKSSWPSCKIDISGASFGGGQVSVNGRCLENSAGVTLVNTATSEKFDLNILSKSAEKLQLKPTSSKITIAANTLYRLLIKDALGQVTESSITVSLENNMTFPYLKDGNGNILGDILPMGGMMNGGTNFVMESSNGELLNYLTIDGYYNTSKLYLMPNFQFIPNVLSAMSNKQLARNGMLPWVQSFIYFSGPDCTGDLIVNVPPAHIPGALRGNIMVQPKGCTKTTNASSQEVWTCTGWDYFRLSGSPTRQSNITYQSYLNQGWGADHSANGTFSYCYNSPTPYNVIDAMVFSSAQKVPFGPNDPAIQIQNASIVGR
jgi:hypothetical protein